MLEILLLIGLIVLVVVLISASRRKRELTEVQTSIAREEYKQKRKPVVHTQSNQEIYDALGKIKELLYQGVLSNEEFETEKKRILSGSGDREPVASSANQGNASDPLADLGESEIIGELARRGYRA
jgi:hypothetical protein